MKLRADSLLAKLQYLALIGIVMAQVWGKPSVSSHLFLATFVLTACMWLVMACRKVSSVNSLAIFIVLASCVSVSVNALATTTGISFAYFKKLIMFCCTVLQFSAMQEYCPQKADIQLVFHGNTILAVFLTLMYVWQEPQMHLLNSQITDYLTFRFTNPNLTAVFLAAICMIEAVHVMAAKGKFQRLLHVGLAGVMAYFVYETRARNAQLLLAFFWTVFFLVALFPKSRPRMTGWIAGLIAVFPLVFSLVYLLLIHTQTVQDLFSFLVGTGKKLDSRVGIWDFALKAFASSPFFGAYSEISRGTGLSQLHNTHLDVLASYGCLVLGMLCVFLFWLLYHGNAGRKCFLCRMGFAALLLSGTGEAMLFSGGMGIYLYAGVFLMLANVPFSQAGESDGEKKQSNEK